MFVMCSAKVTAQYFFYMYLLFILCIGLHNG